MLPFLKILKLENFSIGKPAADNSDSHDNTKQNPTSGHSCCTPQLPMVKKQKLVLESTVIFGTLFVLSALCLLFMIKKTSPQTAAAVQIDIKEARLDMAIARLNEADAETFNTVDKITKKFYELENIQQVPLDELIKNPFKIEKHYSPEQSDNMQLLSIIATNTGNACMIDYKLLRKGDYIRGFKITKITDTYVELESQQQTNRTNSAIQPKTRKIVLRLSE